MRKRKEEGFKLGMARGAMDSRSWAPSHSAKTKKPLILTQKETQRTYGFNESLDKFFKTKSSDTGYKPWPNRWRKK